MKRDIFLSLSLVAFLFVGCGSSNTKNTNDNDTSSFKKIEEGAGEGVLVDSEVNGVNYRCGKYSGITGDTGRKGGFEYEVGQDCKFTINDIVISEVAGSKLDSNKMKIKVGDLQVARFLQSLDNDGNPDNGIKITKDAVKVLKENSVVSLPKTDTQLQNIVTTLDSAGIGYGGHMVDKTSAQQHLGGFTFDISANKTKINLGDEVKFAVDVKGGNSSDYSFQWLDNGADMGENSPSFSTKNLSSGRHTIKVNVTKSDVTLSDSLLVDVISTGDFAVTIKGGKSSYNINDFVKLSATSVGGLNSPSYVWKDNGKIIAGQTTNNLNKKFPAGEHNVSVEITSDGITKNDSLIFHVVDAKNFDIDSEKGVITQLKKDLMWINKKSTTSKVSCLAIHRDNPKKDVTPYSKQDDSFANAKVFCSRLSFAGFTNWRTPTTEELSEFIKDTYKAGIQTEYDHPCMQLLSIIPGGNPQKGESYRAVSTRFMFAKYKVSVGSIQDHDYSSKYKNDPKYGVGLRCVRNIDGSGGEDIPINNDNNNSSTNKAPIANAGADQSVKNGEMITFDGSKSSDPDGHIVKYEWLYGGRLLNSDTTKPTYSRKVTKAGGQDAEVTLRVTDDKGATATDSMVVHIIN